MNYDKRIYDLIQDIKNDKSISTKWRNKAMARFDEGHAFIGTGQREMNNLRSEGVQAPASISNPNQNVDCTCLPSTRDKTCPVHGDTA
jgi:hypothetical protein